MKTKLNTFTAALLGALLTASLFLVVPRLLAQINGLGGGAAVQGTTNGPPVTTNTASISLRPVTWSVSGGTNAASIFVGNVYASLNGSTNGAVLIGSVTNAIGTGTFSTNSAALTTNVNVTIYLTAITGTNTLTVGGIYGP